MSITVDGATLARGNQAISVRFGSEPEITGLVMPVRWDYETGAPATEPPVNDDEDGGE